MGKEHKDMAREQYIDQQKKKHDSFYCRKSGLFLYKKFAFMGANPDGLVNCKCHETRVLEIKCPY